MQQTSVERLGVTSAILVLLNFVVLLPAPVCAQQSASGIAGVVKDSSGGALPGVTVESASPALIEKVRTVVTDGEGRYSFVDLRPGAYTVTFTLPGFSTFKREGIDLGAGFTATVNAEMQVGALEETITVTGAAPLVDTQSVRQQQVLSTESLRALPTGAMSVVNMMALTPGLAVNPSLGGSTGAYHEQGGGGAYHGRSGRHVTYDGMRIDNYAGGGSSAGYLFNSQTVAESVVQTGGAGAESPSPSVSVQMVPKEGSNVFNYALLGTFTNHSLQTDNLSDDLIARGLTLVPKVNRVYDAGFTIGGPIRQDRVWLFGAIRRWGTKNQAAGLFWNKTQGTPFYTPDLSRPAFRDERYQSHATRITWQVSRKDKVNFFVDIKNDCICESGGTGSGLGSGATNAQEGEAPWHLWPNGMVQGAWSAPVTSKLLFEAGASMVMFHWPNYLSPGVTPEDVAITEQSTSMRYNNVGGIYTPVRRLGDRFAQRFGASYVTGSHVFKTGFQNDVGYSDTVNEPLGLSVGPGISYTFNRGAPVNVRYDATPRHETYYQKAELGIYAQDQWTLQRVTFNYGLRFDYYLGYIPRVDRPAGPFVPEAHFDPIHGAPSWKDINPRLGAVYDLFGNGRTAAKVSVGRYVSQTGNGQVSQYHPLNTSINNTTRSWADANGNYRPDCDLYNFAKNGECGPLANQNFGKTDPNARQFADDARYGIGARPYTWDVTTELQHQLGTGVSLNVGYDHNWSGGFTVTDNLKVGPENFSTYCVTAPTDARLPGGGGYKVCGLADVNPDRFGEVTELVTKATNFGNQVRVSDFVAVNLTTRFGSGLRLGGGIDTGRTIADNCFVVDSPAQLLTAIDGQPNCRVVTPIAGNTEVKFNGSYPLPAGLSVAATYQNMPGLQWLASYAATTAEIAPSLGRNLSGGTRSATAPLIQSQTIREPRRSQLDLRFSKAFTVRQKGRVQVNFDLYNATNESPVLGMNTNYGPSWLVPTLILGGRLAQFSGSWSF